jgi:prepilin-type N-terminal cleavage/methylation domain-containing protein
MNVTSRSLPRRRSAFTLVEMLVVIVIIAILAAAVVPAVFLALNKAREATIAMEVGNLQQALEQCKVDWGDYPPDFATDTSPAAQIDRYLTGLYRYRRGDAPPDLDLNNLDPAEALFFWLGGSAPPANPNSNGPRPHPGGLSSDPAKPVSSVSKRTPRFDFDQTRLTDRDADGFLEYVPEHGMNTPYVYFHHRSYSSGPTWVDATNPESGTARPYGNDQQGRNFVKPDKFQLICAGQDGNFGQGGFCRYPSGLGYTDGDNDNITSFSEGSTLEDQMP